ncbi:MAG: hypothetical protein GXO88_09990 [Chlorobi bacterium]|nr:hypothetical protein [Chlorobiota bacterium]
MRFNLKQDYVFPERGFSPSRVPVKTLVLLMLMLLNCRTSIVLGQNGQNATMDFSVENQTLSATLYKLSSKCGYNISYDAGNELLDEKISIRLEDKYPEEIYKEILSDTKLSFKKVGNLIVVYQLPASPENNPLPEQITSGQLTLRDTVPDAETIFKLPLTDTLFIRDTIYRLKTDTILLVETDTVTIIDTVFLKKKKQKKPKKTKQKTSDLISTHIPRQNGWSAEIFMAPVASSFSLSRENSPLTVRSFAIGADFSKILDRINISATVKLSHFAEKFNNTYLVTEGGFFRTDTIDEYYTVSDIDTTWYYVTDSTWLPVDDKQYSYNVNNRVGFIDISVKATYDFYVSKKTRIFAGLGLQTGILIYKSGLAVPDGENQPEGVDFAGLNFNNTVFSGLVNLGMKYQLSKTMDFKSEFYYFQGFNDVVSSYPVNNKLKGLGLKLGLAYYF